MKKKKILKESALFVVLNSKKIKKKLIYSFIKIISRELFDKKAVNSNKGGF